jgi:hypothetical protein
MTTMTLRDVAKVIVPVPFQSLDAYFFDFMNWFREIQSLLFLVCDDVLKSMKVMKVMKVMTIMKVMSKVARFSFRIRTWMNSFRF